MSTERMVVGFQLWLNGRPNGYGTTLKMYGMPSMTESECADVGEREDAGMTYRYLGEDAPE